MTATEIRRKIVPNPNIPEGWRRPRGDEVKVVCAVAPDGRLVLYRHITTNYHSLDPLPYFLVEPAEHNRKWVRVRTFADAVEVWSKGQEAAERLSL